MSRVRVTHYTTVSKKTARLLTIVYSNDRFRTFSKLDRFTESESSASQYIHCPTF